MLIAFQVCFKDAAELIRLLEWCQRLGSYKDHDALIAADAATPWDKALEALKLAKIMFRTATILTNEAPIDDWVSGPKSLFLLSARHAAKNGQAFLVMETDSIPLRAGWLDEIACEYAACGKPFMGHIYECNQPNLPSRLMSGIGVYSPEILNAEAMIQAGRNWDVAMTEYVVPRAHDTKLVRHLWGEPNRAPTFARKGVAGTEIFGLDQIPPEAVIWHRNKDGSLIRLLERKFFPELAKSVPITACFNVHAGDVDLAILHAKWLQKMGRKHSHTAIVCHDPSCPITKVTELRELLTPLFEKLETFCYSRPPVPTYPASANWAWQSTAFEMSRRGTPWFWIEADGICLKPDWLERLQFEYDGEGMSFMGAVVPHMGHVNGSAIYPADTPARMPRAMATPHGEAWDMRGKDDMGADRHDSKLFFHLWTLVNRMPHPVGGGELPLNITADELRQWPIKDAAYVHRVKDASMLNLLLSGAWTP